jgi:hypothetical protein
MTGLTEIVIWTALPNGVAAGGKLKLSVIVSPRLQSPSVNPILSSFPDWVDWPSTISGVTFDVTFAGFPTIHNLTPTNTAYDSTGWQAIFDPNQTAVESYNFHDFSGTQIISYDHKALENLVSSIYTAVAATPTDFPQLSKHNRVWQAPKGSQAATAFTNLLALSHAQGGGLDQHNAYRNRPGVNGFTPPKAPKIDFHQGLSSINHFPVLQRRFGIVFDLLVPKPSGLSGNTTVSVNPHWTSAFDSSGDTIERVSMPTAAAVTGTTFRPRPLGSDYGNGMLDLTDTARFSVSDVDVDLAADRLLGLSRALVTLTAVNRPDREGSRATFTVPALRTAGPTLVWTGLGPQFSNLAALQTGLQQGLQDFLDGFTGSPPTVFAEHIIRGHRIDVFTSSEASPAWRSLMGRYGTYQFGSNSADIVKALDEGAVGFTAASDSTDTPQPTDTLYMPERVARWQGWGLAANFPGQVVSEDNPSGAPNPGNPAVPPGADGQSQTLPQLSATFIAPGIAPIPGSNPLPFPKLRFGNRYRLRARGVDLAGNGETVDSNDGSTATPAMTHYRYEPVLPPVFAHTAPLGPGEATLYLVLLNDQIHTPTPNGRWLFPPRVSQQTCEEHGMFDGFALGSPPDPSQPPTPEAYAFLVPPAPAVQPDAALITDVAGVQFDGNADPTNPPPYFPGNQLATPWLADPLSAGPALVGLPGVAAGTTFTKPWDGGLWPALNPILLRLSPGAPSTNFSAATASKSPVIDVTLPPAAASIVRVSNALTAAALHQLGVYQWVLAAAGASAPTLARNGNAWLLSPYQVLRMVHAVRLPLVAPKFQNPSSSRDVGATSADLSDPNFLVDENSTSSLDFEATWTDPYDNPADPQSDPSDPAKNTRTITAQAFKLTVPDPVPSGPDEQPLSVSPPVETFAFGPETGSGAPSSTHHIGDTKHHIIEYAVTGTSRFAELFSKNGPQTFTGTTPLQVSTPQLGINPVSVVITPTNSETPIPASAYTVDPDAGTIALTSGTGSKTYNVTFQPKVTRTGPPVPVEILSSARPPAPTVARILPAWEWTDSDNGVVKAGRVDQTRTGGYLRVFLDRPWFATGAHEMLGVVTANKAASLSPTEQAPLTTLMGLDPITYSQARHRSWPPIPTNFGALGNVPDVAGRAPYDDPPQLELVEDPGEQYTIWPYKVNYDAGSQQWFADVKLLPGQTVSGTFLPPPGYFVRLVLVRFQPYSLNGVEISPTTTATIAQPVPDRFVTVVKDSADASKVIVTVTGPGYQGWRPVVDPVSGGVQIDGHNPDSPQVYDSGTTGHETSSSMLVEVQAQDTSTGLSGELSWKPITSPVRLPVTFSSEISVQWGGEPTLGSVALPQPIGSARKMRLRISEVDFLPANGRLQSNTGVRRPFVTFVPLN